MSNAPLMPKATAVWLLDNTALTFDQVADFTKMHPLEIRAIADGDAAQGIKGIGPDFQRAIDPRGDREGREGPEPSPQARGEQGGAAAGRQEEGPALHAGVAPPRAAERDPVAGAQSSRVEGRADHAPRRHHQDHDRERARPHPLECLDLDADGPGDARPVLADRTRFRGAARGQGKADRPAIWRRHPAAGLRDHQEGAGVRDQAEKSSDDLNVDAVFAKLKTIGGKKQAKTRNGFSLRC